MPKLARYLRIYRTFFVSSFQRELQFRANFLAKMALSGTWVLFYLLILFVVFSRAQSVAGWTQAQSFILASTVFLMESFMRGFFMSLMEIPSMTRLGTLDFVLTKPIDSQFWVSTRKFALEQIGMMVVGLVMITISTRQAHITGSFVDWLGYLILVPCALIIFYSFGLAMMTLGIFLVKVENLWVLTEMTLDLCRYPVDIFGGSIRMLLIYVLPLAFLGTIPASQLVRGFDLGSVLLGMLWAIVAFTASRMFWRYATRHYSSASS